jgi:predicted aminopeptidase
MAVAMNLSAFKALIMGEMNRFEALERTPEGRAKLSAGYRAEAKRLRATSPGALWVQAGGEMNTHVASPMELARRAEEGARLLEQRADALDAIKGASGWFEAEEPTK